MNEQTTAELLGARVKARREDLGLSIYGLCDKAGIASTSIYNIESGRITPGTEVLVKLADELKVTTDWLLGRAKKLTRWSKPRGYKQFKSVTREEALVARPQTPSEDRQAEPHRGHTAMNDLQSAIIHQCRALAYAINLESGNAFSRTESELMRALADYVSEAISKPLIEEK